MAASSKLMIGEAERRFPVRIRLAVPAGGFGKRLHQMQAWLDETCGADGWAMTPSGQRGVVNDAVAVYFRDPTLASGFVARWCAANRVETAEGAFRVREDAPTPRIGATPHGNAVENPQVAGDGGAFGTGRWLCWRIFRPAPLVDDRCAYAACRLRLT